jgi:hypothetical protein
VQPLHLHLHQPLHQVHLHGHLHQQLEHDGDPGWVVA